MDFEFHLLFGPVDTAVNTLLDRHWLVPETCPSFDIVIAHHSPYDSW